MWAGRWSWTHTLPCLLWGVQNKHGCPADDGPATLTGAASLEHNNCPAQALSLSPPLFSSLAQRKSHGNVYSPAVWDVLSWSGWPDFYFFVSCFHVRSRGEYAAWAISHLKMSTKPTLDGEIGTVFYWLKVFRIGSLDVHMSDSDL